MRQVNIYDQEELTLSKLTHSRFRARFRFRFSVKNKTNLQPIDRREILLYRVTIGTVLKFTQTALHHLSITPTQILLLFRPLTLVF